MTDRATLVRMFVLNSICDDYEEPIEFAGMPPAEPPLEWYEGYSFWITPAGREMHMTFSDWPLNDDGELRAGWNPPSK